MREKEWSKAWARFEALRSNVPTSITTARVSEYHSILDDLERYSGDDLSKFRVPGDQMKPRVAGARLATYRRPGQIYYSDDVYCDDGFFARQIQGVANYFGSLKAKGTRGSNVDQPTDYWSMSDSELEILATKHNIPPISRAGQQGETWYIDRERIIDSLLKRDSALRGAQPAPRSNVINVGSMYSSVIQQDAARGSAQIDYKSKESDLRNLLDRLRNSAGELKLSAAARGQLDADTQTVEVQLSSPHPKPSIISECNRFATFSKAPLEVCLRRDCCPN